MVLELYVIRPIRNTKPHTHTQLPHPQMIWLMCSRRVVSLHHHPQITHNLYIQIPHPPFLSSETHAHTQLTMNDFSVHRIIGRGGFGEVYGCRKADTGKMYAMKCLDKKRIKMKQGETLALNERTMLSLVSTGVSTEAPPPPQLIVKIVSHKN